MSKLCTHVRYTWHILESKTTSGKSPYAMEKPARSGMIALLCFWMDLLLLLLSLSSSLLWWWLSAFDGFTKSSTKSWTVAGEKSPWWCLNPPGWRKSLYGFCSRMVHYPKQIQTASPINSDKLWSQVLKNRSRSNVYKKAKKWENHLSTVNIIYFNGKISHFNGNFGQRLPKWFQIASRSADREGGRHPDHHIAIGFETVGIDQYFKHVKTIINYMLE